MKNKDIAALLQKYADHLEMTVSNPYRIKAYRKAARYIDKFSESITHLIENGYDLTTIPTIGKNIAEKILAIVKTGEIKLHAVENVKKALTLNELVLVKGLGPKRIKILREQYHIHTRQQLKQFILSNQLQRVSGFTENLAKKILDNLDTPITKERFLKFKFAQKIIIWLEKQITQLDFVEHVVCAGSYRRKSEIVGNLIFIVVSSHPKKIIKDFINLKAIKDLISVTSKKAVVNLHYGPQVTLHAIKPQDYAIQLLHHTGSKKHIEHLKSIAVHHNLVLTEAGLFYNNMKIKSNSEQDIYYQLDLEYIEPELREDRGEIEASIAHNLPDLIYLENIKGDLHSHTNESDGSESLETMAQAAKNKGYEYFAITDHSQRLVIAHGLDEKRLLQQISLIDNLNSKLFHITILKGIEVDILEDGSLDLSDNILKELDICVCSIHSKFNLTEEKQTERIIRAMDNRYFNILGHPSGRLIPHRKPYPLNIEKILMCAKERGCYIELNAQPARLDLNDQYCQIAKSLGVKISISSDAHSIPGLDFMEFGVSQARKGWLECNDVINTRGLHELKKLLKRC